MHTSDSFDPHDRRSDCGGGERREPDPGDQGTGLPGRAPAGSRAARLLVVATGNVANAALLALVAANLDAILAAPGEADFVELGPEAMVV